MHDETATPLNSTSLLSRSRFVTIVTASADVAFATDWCSCLDVCDRDVAAIMEHRPACPGRAYAFRLHKIWTEIVTDKSEWSRPGILIYKRADHPHHVRFLDL
jgi:hypothetical protein